MNVTEKVATEVADASNSNEITDTVVNTDSKEVSEAVESSDSREMSDAVDESTDSKKATEAIAETSEVNATRKPPQRRARSTWWPNVQKEIQDEPEVHSDSDPPWEPVSDEDGAGKRRSKRIRGGVKRSLRESSTSSSDEEYLPSRRNKRNNARRKQASTTVASNSTPQIRTPVPIAPKPTEFRVRVVSQEKLLEPAALVNTTLPPPKENNPIVFKKTPYPVFPFNVGEFVIATSDQKYYYPPLWRVKEHNMLHRFIPFVRNGVPLYHNIPTYTAWSPGSKYVYVGIEVKFVTHIKRNVNVRLMTTNLHKITSGQEIVDNSVRESQKYQDFFDIFIQTLISQALDPNFLKEIVEQKDDYFLSNIRVIDECCEEIRGRLKTALGWNEQILNAISKLATYKSRVNASNCLCGEKAEVCVSLEGNPYDYMTLKRLNEQLNSTEISVCNKCFENFQVLHKLCHHKQYLFVICDELVQIKKNEDDSKSATSTILNELLADNDWLTKMFVDTCKLWGYAEKLIIDLSK